MSPMERYFRDAQFHAVVDALTAQLAMNNYTVTDLLQAVICACVKVETRGFIGGPVGS